MRKKKKNGFKSYNVKGFQVKKKQRFQPSFPAIIITVLVILLIGVSCYSYYKINDINAENDYQKTVMNNVIAGTDSGIQKTRMHELYQNYKAQDKKTLSDPFVVVAPFEEQNPLSAYVAFESDDPVKVYYSVKGKTSESTFNYTADSYQSGTVVVPIIGLYAYYNNEVTISLENKGGDVSSHTLNIDTNSVSSQIPDERLKLNITIKNQNAYNDLMENSWLIDNGLTAYDINGDIRAYDSARTYWDNISMKQFDGKLYTANSQIEGLYNTSSLTSINLMGVLDDHYSFNIPDDDLNSYFHHDLTFDGENYYILATSVDENVTYRESYIYVYDKNFNYEYQIDMADYIIVDGTQILANSNKNDLHLNSIDYLKEKDELILSSRSTSCIYGFNIKNQEIDWVIGDQSQEANPELKDKYLTVSNPDKFKYTSGQHSAFVVDNEKAVPYTKDGKILISVFDNQSCVDANGKNVLVDIANGKKDNSVCTDVNSRVLFYALDLKENTVEMVDKIDLDTRSVYVSNIMSHDNGFVVASRMGYATYYYDIDGNLIAKFEYSGKQTNYRADVFDEEQINQLI